MGVNITKLIPRNTAAGFWPRYILNDFAALNGRSKHAHLPAISEYDRSSILLVLGNSPQFDELRAQAKRFDNSVVA